MTNRWGQKPESERGCCFLTTTETLSFSLIESAFSSSHFRDKSAASTGTLPAPSVGALGGTRNLHKPPRNDAIFPCSTQSFDSGSYPEEGAIMQRLSGHLQSSSVSCSIPKLWPISWATVVATRPTDSLWSMFTPPEYWYVQMGPFRALPTTPESNAFPLKKDKFFSSKTNETKKKLLKVNPTFKSFFFSLEKVLLKRWNKQSSKSLTSQPS